MLSMTAIPMTVTKLFVLLFFFFAVAVVDHDDWYPIDDRSSSLLVSASNSFCLSLGVRRSSSLAGVSSLPVVVENGLTNQLTKSSAVLWRILGSQKEKSCRRTHFVQQMMDCWNAVAESEIILCWRPFITSKKKKETMSSAKLQYENFLVFFSSFIYFFYYYCCCCCFCKQQRSRSFFFFFFL